MANTADKSHKSKSTQNAPFTPAALPAGQSLAQALKGAGPPPTPPTAAEVYKAAERASEIQDAVAEFSQPKELDRTKQSWYRPADSKARKLVDKIVVHRAAGRSDAEIAKLLKTTEQSIRQYVYLGKKNGWLDGEGEPIDVEAELAHNIDAKIVRNISASLDGQMTNWQTHEMTVQAAKGRGIFKNHEKTEATGVLAPVAIQIIMPALSQAQQRMEIPENMLGGVPAFVDGEVVGGTNGN
jgi:transposase